MTTVVVLTGPPDESDLPALQPDPLTPAEASTLSRAMLADVCATVQHGEANLLVNYPPADRLDGVSDPEEVLRGALAGEVPDPDAVRYEVQVGKSYAGRVGNALTHLLDSEDVGYVGVVDQAVPLFRREHVGNAAMKLRTSEVVLGPTTDGGVYFAAFDEPIDFAETFTSPAVETLTERGLDAGLDVDFLPMLPCVDGPARLATVVSQVRARLQADRLVPPRTAALVQQWGLAVDEDGIQRRSDRS